MTKRDIMIESLTFLEKAKLEKLTDEELKQRVAGVLNCDYCPAYGTKHCANYQTCSESIESWYEGG